MAGNKNQHFVPRCYLKPFTLDGAGKAINLHNLDRAQSIPRTPVKGQCSGDYFYGEDLRIERRLQSLEGEYAAMLADLRQPDYRLTDEHRHALRRFWLLQYLRTEAASLRLAQMFDQLDVDLGGLPEGYKLPIKEAVQAAMRVFDQTGDTVDDLHVCLVRSRQEDPFITSDNPAVLTNRWHLTDGRVRGVSPGIRNSGAIGMLPLAPDIMLLLFDGAVHTLPNNKGWAVAGREDVDTFNEHQAMNCNANLYFRDWESRAGLEAAVPRWISRRPETRHRIHHMVLDRRTDEGAVYRVVPAAEARGQEGMIHSEAITPEPSRWLSLLKWRSGGFAYDSGTGEGYLRPQRRDQAQAYRKVRLR